MEALIIECNCAKYKAVNPKDHSFRSAYGVKLYGFEIEFRDIYEPKSNSIIIIEFDFSHNIF